MSTPPLPTLKIHRAQLTSQTMLENSIPENRKFSIRNPSTSFNPTPP